MTTPSRQEIRADLGAVSATHPYASAAGMAVLERGGNAFDAAVAAAFVLHVVMPHNNGPGGDVSIVLYDARTSGTRSICGQGPMPAGARLESFQALGLKQIPGSGLLPATVPGAVGAWLRLLAEFGTLPLAEVLEYAIGHASRGVPVLPDVAHAIATLAPLYLADWTGSAATYLRDGRAPTPYSRHGNPILAETYSRLIRAGEQKSSREARIEAASRAFYEGFVADAIDRFTRETEALDSTGRRHRALLTGQDLVGWQPEVEEATALDFRGYRVFKPGPWSQGPVFLQQLSLLDGFDLAAMDPAGADYLHTMVECAKLAFADREAWYGDPRHTDVPLAALLDPGYGERRRGLVGPEARTSLLPGAPDGRESWIPTPASAEPYTGDDEWMSQIQSGLPTVVRATAARTDTCCVTVADRHGNIVAGTPSGGWLKSSPAIAELGFPLGTRGQTMWLVEGHPNAVAPGRRPRTTLSPTVVLRDGRPFLAFGTPGGDQQDQWTLQFFLGVTEFGLDLQRATEMPAFHTDAFPASFTPRETRVASLTVERTVGDATVAELRRRGHDVKVAPPLSLGKVCATGFTVDDDNFILAAAGPRGQQAYAVGR
ncbi:MAG: gamma-glutamyltransferase [Actinobacteria bacterium 13_2_20CM_2_71_6]|nr:MAG: gamma-glutamyltransferase [Actinobacteria bacterium 13_2_20CM_2_71_6]